MATKKNENNEQIPVLNEEGGTLGDIKINHSVVASIVRLAATEVTGVYSIGGTLVEGITEIFSKKESDRGVRVSENEVGNYCIEVRVILAFGVSLANVAVQIQEVVKEQVHKMTMKNVDRVDVIIDGVKMEDKPKRKEYEVDL